MNEPQQCSQSDTGGTDNCLSAARDALFIEEQKRTLSSIYTTYILTPSTPEGREMKKNLLQQIKDYSRPDLMATLENLANRRFDNIVTRIRELDFKANDIALLCYIVNGFPLSHIAVIMGVEPPTLSTRKSRLKAKLRSIGVSSRLPGFQLGQSPKPR